MTVQTQTLPIHSQFNFTFLLNAIILALCAAAILYYVLWSNSLAAGNYRLSTLRKTLTQLTETNSSLLTRKSAMEDPSAAIEFARNHGMIEATNISYVFESGNVALQH